MTKIIFAAAALILIGLPLFYFSGGDEEVSGSKPAARAQDKKKRSTENPVSDVRTRTGVGTADKVYDFIPSMEWSESAMAETFQAGGEVRELGRKFLGLIYVSPRKSHAEIAMHLGNLLHDDDYPPVADLIVDGNLEKMGMEYLMNDLHSRPDAIKMRVFARIMAKGGHEYAEEAHSVLTTYLNDDVGFDSPSWIPEVERWLKTQE